MRIAFEHELIEMNIYAHIFSQQGLLSSIVSFTTILSFCIEKSSKHSAFTSLVICMIDSYSIIETGIHYIPSIFIWLLLNQKSIADKAIPFLNAIVSNANIWLWRKSFLPNRQAFQNLLKYHKFVTQMA